MARVAIVGTGYVGLCTGVSLLERGHAVTFADVHPSLVAQVQQGAAPFHEPGLDEALARLTPVSATTDVAAAVQGAEFVFLCVGTPTSSTGAIDLAQVASASELVGAALRGSPGKIVVVKSTVVPGTADELVVPVIEKASGAPEGGAFDVASNPEFLREGSALTDARRPDRIVVGAARGEVAARVLSLYESLPGERVVVDRRTAEAIKYAANAMLAARVAFVNELANVCARLGVDWYDVARGIGGDPRIGPLFLRPGAGFGGSCFPKDVAALAHLAEQAGADVPLLRGVLDHNARQPREVVRMLAEELVPLTGRRIALLGLAFKPDTDDVRETRALPLYRELVAAGADVVCHDPRAGDAFAKLAPEARIERSLKDALRGADAAVIQTEWPEYADAATYRSAMRGNVVVDGRRTLDPAAARGLGLRYRAIGLGR